MTRTLDGLSCLMSIIGVVVITCAIFGSGCSSKRSIDSPAKQQKISTSNVAPVVIPAQTPIPVDLIDLDRDGTISAIERQSLTHDQPGVVVTFISIVASVIVASILTAWAGSRWSNRAPRPQARETDRQAAEEPAAPTQTEVDFMGDNGDRHEKN